MGFPFLTALWAVPLLGAAIALIAGSVLLFGAVAFMWGPYML